MTKPTSERQPVTQKIHWEAFVRSFASQLLKLHGDPEVMEALLPHLALPATAARRPFQLLDRFVRVIISAYRENRQDIKRLKLISELLGLQDEFPRTIGGLIHCPVSTYHGTWEDFERLHKGQMNDQTYARVKGNMVYNYLWFFYILNPTRYFYFDKLIIRWLNLNYRAGLDIDFPTLKSYAVKGLQVGELTKLSSAKIVENTYLTNLQRPPGLTYRALPSRASNTIFYGPTASGKTYHMIRRALDIIEGHEPSALNLPDMTDSEKFNHYCRIGRIEFIAMHERTDYEHLVEGIQRVRAEDGPMLLARDGIFKRLCTLARTSLILSSADQVNYNGRIWVFEQVAKGKRKARQYLSDRPELRRQIPSQGNSTNFRPGDLLITIDEQFIGSVSLIAHFQENHPRILEESQEELRFHMHPIAREVYLPLTLISTHIYMFDQSNFGLLEGFRIEEFLGMLKANSIELQGANWMDAPYVFIMDDLQNARVNRAFGDLLTLLEPDRRLGEKNEVRIRLPQSREIFGIPGNVHLLGAVNTSAQSSAPLDANFRHAFDFEELRPHPGCLAKMKAGVNLPLMLHVMNRRIEHLLGQAHTIGHGYFIDLHEDASLTELRKVMEFKVLPLLIETTGHDLALLARIMGLDPQQTTIGGLIDVDHDLERYLGAAAGAGHAPAYRLQPAALDQVATYQQIYEGFTDNDLIE